MMPNPSKVQVGDFFYRNGTSSPIFAPTESNPVIGIVFQTNQERIGEAEKAALDEKAGYLEGTSYVLVMALQNAGSAHWSTPDNTTYVNVPGITDCNTKEEYSADINGLKNYQAVIEYLADNEKYTMDKFPAFKAVQEYQKQIPTPGNSTDWYLPSAGQLYDCYANLGGLPDWLEIEDEYNEEIVWNWSLARIDNYCFKPLADAGVLFDRLVPALPAGDAPEEPMNVFWTSTEHSTGKVINWRIGHSLVHCASEYADGEYLVRPILAFKTSK